MPTMTEKRKSSRVTKLPQGKKQGSSHNESLATPHYDENPPPAPTPFDRERQCKNCHRIPHGNVPRRRTFSEQALAALVLWDEIASEAVDQAICDECYEEMREVLMDRTDEIEMAIKEPLPRRKHVTPLAS